MVTVGEKIKELREAKGLSQNNLAKKIGVHNSNVCHWETGRCEPNLFSCICLADVFGVSLDELCCRDFKGGK
jgi:DNA-binding XRE family transcriptional regulator